MATFTDLFQFAHLIGYILISAVCTYVYPANIFMRLDFPAPDGPIIAVNSPALNSPFIFWRIIRSPAIV